MIRSTPTTENSPHVKKPTTPKKAAQYNTYNTNNIQEKRRSHRISSESYSHQDTTHTTIHHHVNTIKPPLTLLFMLLIIQSKLSMVIITSRRHLLNTRICELNTGRYYTNTPHLITIPYDVLRHSSFFLHCDVIDASSNSTTP